MSYLKNLVFEISFIDPMSTLAIFLLWLHYYMLFFICLVMLFVCVVMIKLINDYNWTVFQRTPFYFDLYYATPILVDWSHKLYTIYYNVWLRFCYYYLFLLRHTFIIVRNQKNNYPRKMSFWFTTLSSPSLSDIKTIKFTKKITYSQRASKLGLLMGSIGSWYENVLHRIVNLVYIKILYGYEPMKLPEVSKEEIYYNRVGDLLNDFSCKGYYNTKLRFHLRKYSDFFHIYFWRSNLFFELQLALIPFIIAVLLIIPSVIVTSFITDPERKKDFDEDSPLNAIDSNVDVIGHQWYWQYRIVNVTDQTWPWELVTAWPLMEWIFEEEYEICALDEVFELQRFTPEVEDFVSWHVSMHDLTYMIKDSLIVDLGAIYNSDSDDYEEWVEDYSQKAVDALAFDFEGYDSESLYDEFSGKNLEYTTSFIMDSFLIDIPDYIINLAYEHIIDKYEEIIIDSVEDFQTSGYNAMIVDTWKIFPYLDSILVPLDEPVERSLCEMASEMYLEYAKFLFDGSVQLPDVLDPQPFKYKVDEYIIENSNLSVLTEEDYANNKRRLIEVDKKLFLRPGSRTRFLITSADVIHSFALPALGLKLDAVPYRLSYQVPRIRNYEAILYGFCSELCGVQHAQMPIEAVVTNIRHDEVPIGQEKIYRVPSFELTWV